MREMDLAVSVLVAGGGDTCRCTIGGEVVDGEEIAAACWTLNCSHELRNSAAMASSVLHEFASFLHESATS
jgi:hypothetical protein